MRFLFLNQFFSDGVKVAPVPAQNVIRKPQPVTVKEDAIVTVKDVSSDAPSLNKLSEVLKLSQKGLEPEVIKVSTNFVVIKIFDFVPRFYTIFNWYNNVAMKKSFAMTYFHFSFAKFCGKLSLRSFTKLYKQKTCGSFYSGNETFLNNFLCLP